MAKLKYDNTNVEPSQFKQPTPGLYTARIEECNHRDEDGKNDVEVVLVIDGGEFDNAKLWTYIPLSEQAAWKMLEFTDALGLPKKGTLDTAKAINKKIKVKVSADQWQGEYRARATRLSPLTATPEDDEPAEEAEVEAEAADEVTVEDEYDSWETEELLAVITEDEDLTASYPGGHDEDNEWLIGFLRAADADELEEWLAENSEAVDYSEWSVDEVKAELERRGLDVPKRAPKSKLIGLLEANDGDDSDPFEGE